MFQDESILEINEIIKNNVKEGKTFEVKER